MSDWLITLYPWVKSVHIMAVIAWMAGLFYLPRLFVYHAEQVQNGTDRDRLFQTMELKLLRVIMAPSMIVTWFLGLVLVMTPGVVDWSMIWPWIKMAGVFGMTWFHMWLAGRRRDFVDGANRLSGRRYRLMNEVPTLLMIAIVFAVVVKF